MWTNWYQVMGKSILAITTLTILMLTIPSKSYASSITIAPEPIEFILYGLGGIPLAFHLLRRKLDKKDQLAD